MLAWNNLFGKDSFVAQLMDSVVLLQLGNGPGSPGGICCQALSEVKLENTDKTS